MWKSLAVFVAIIILAGTPLLRAQDDQSFEPFSPEQLDNLLAPVALYPDPLLAQVLAAATFPDQVDEAARFVRGGANPDDIDTEPWDVSVKAVAHYPTALYLMADGLDWTTALGQAYINQGDDVMASVQRLREEARNAGNLVTTPQQDVEVDDGSIEIWPAQPQYCYIPVYDPGLVFFGSGGVYGGPVITFGIGFPIGAWLNRDFDWRHRHIYYHGWSEGRGWIARSRPFVHVNNVYVNNNYRNVTVNRGVLSRPVNLGNLSRYNSVHQNVNYGRPSVNAGGGVNSPYRVNNKIIERNTNPNDSRIEQYRGRSFDRQEPDRGVPSRPAVQSPRPAERSGSSAFGGNRGGIDARTSSQRGQGSRSEAARPAPAAPRSSGGGGGSHTGGGGGGGSHSNGGGGGGKH